ncbi:MAG: hypothetical protein ACYST6_07360 [Planctomycetota bacterium]
MRAHYLHYMGYIALIFVMIIPSRLTGAEIGGPEVLEQLRSLDKVFLQAATINLDANSHSNWPERDTTTRVKTTLTTDGSSIGWTSEIFYISPPVYVVNNPWNAVDGRTGNYLIWRTTRSSALIESDFQGYHDERILLSVSPDGTFTETKGVPTLELRRADDSEKFVLFKRVMWSCGRGFADHLDKIVKAEQDQDGFINIEADGSSGSKMVQGVWKLRLDPDAGYLVRSASFTPTQLPQPTYLFASTGMKWTGGVPVAEEAVYSVLGNIKTVKARTSQFQPKVDQQLLDRLRNKLRGRLPKDTRVNDFRNNPREPSSYIVGRGSVSDKYLLDVLVNPLKLDSTVRDTKENGPGELDAPGTHEGNEISVNGVNQSQDETLNKKTRSGSKSIFWTIPIGALSLILCAYIITTLSRRSKS